MITTIQVEQEIAAALHAKADALGMTLSAYLRSIADDGGATPETGFNGAVSSAEDFDALLEEFFDQNPKKLPSLPVDFSRADSYADHD